MIDNLIGGRTSRERESGRTQSVHDPATGEAIGELGLSSVEDVGEAVAAAKAALPDWARLPPMKRAAVMFRFNELLERHAEGIARAISREHGKTHADALGEVQRGKEVVEFCCGIPQLLKGEFSRNVGPEIDSWSDRQPLGVCAGITPVQLPGDGAPLDVPRRHRLRQHLRAQALRARPHVGADDRRELLYEAGLPAGVMNVVHGDKEAVDALLDHPDVQAVSFVGSTPIAEYVYRRGTEAGKRVQALGGAKNHNAHPARRRSRSGGRCPDGGGLRLRGRALHGGLGGRAGRRGDGRSPGREAPSPRRGAEGGGRRRTTPPRWDR